MVFRLLAQVLLGGLSAGNDCFQEYRCLVLDERDEVHVIVTSNDKDALTLVSVLIGMLDRIEQVTSLDMKDDFFEPNAALSFERLILRVVPGEVLHQG